MEGRKLKAIHVVGETGEKWDMGRTGTLLYLEKYSANQQWGCINKKVYLGTTHSRYNSHCIALQVC